MVAKGYGSIASFAHPFASVALAGFLRSLCSRWFSPNRGGRRAPGPWQMVGRMAERGCGSPRRGRRAASG
jgi:hypothetical protein